ncbi:hypothetical protein CLV30_112130 [Haloactinopolyspora alba]|uniref:Uncharacterized protein n=1 Tax=Haloactinopolyspora alba TaxID=648780 RepID=A0A2P8DXE8_9ACTN|nr:DUF6758 family protein [Haloactinopolyspora alba]PSL01890.1 hypothetical protein CLV30_112130 [Haloactinopolyspora alba]
MAPLVAPSARLVRRLGERSRVPMWLPWPLPHGWVVGAMVHAGDDATGVRAAGVAISGPNPLGGPADLVLVSEEQGVGLGAGLAGLDGPDPGTAVQGEPSAKVLVHNRAVPLWFVDGPADRAVYAGHWGGTWLWAVLSPSTAGVLLLEDVEVVDLRDLGHEADLLPYGTPPPWLSRGYDL